MNIYVGNLSFTTTDEELNRLFASYGQIVKANVIKDRDSGRSKGFGFVEMPVDAEANAAIDALNGQEFNARKLVVNQARERTERRDSGSSRPPFKKRFGGRRE